MEELRYSKRLRAKTHSHQQLIITNSSASSLLHDSLPRPPYHPAFGTVITSNQLETLRRHITVYATICQQLAHMQTSSPSPPLNAGIGTSSPVKTTRYRWAPSHEQVQTLESFYDSGVGTPSKQQVREITSQLSQYGPVTETNVYNWFQNRKARSRRKQKEPEPESEDTDGKERFSEGSPTFSAEKASQSRAGEASEAVPIFLNGQRFDAPTGCFNVKEVFGEDVELVQEQERVPVDQTGVTLQPLIPGVRYRLKGRANDDDNSDEVSQSEWERPDTREREFLPCEPSELGTGPSSSSDIMRGQSLSVDENMSLQLSLTAPNYKLTELDTSEQTLAAADAESPDELSAKVFAKRSVLPVHKSDSPT